MTPSPLLPEPVRHLIAAATPVLRIHGVGGVAWTRNVAKGSRIGPWRQGRFDVRCLDDPIRTLGTPVASHLATDGTGTALQHLRDRSQAVSLLKQARQRHAVFGLQWSVSRRHLHT
jgi:hypothetical protein